MLRRSIPSWSWRVALSLICVPTLAGCPAKGPSEVGEDGGAKAAAAEQGAADAGKEAGGEPTKAAVTPDAELYVDLPGVRSVELPSSPRSAASTLAPALSGTEGVWLGWMHDGEKGPRLRLSKGTIEVGELSWSPPETAVESESVVMDWTNLPAVVESSSGRLIVAWSHLNVDGDTTKGYGLRVASRLDGGGFGAGWDPAEGVQGPESGFPEFVVAGSSVRMFWLDGQDMARDDGRGDMQLRSMVLDAEGQRSAPARIVDPRVCECCRIGGSLIGKRPLVVYRDRGAAELRDIWVAGPGVPAAPVAKDGWVISGCPTNGPSAAPAGGGGMHVAWFTGAGGVSKLNVATGSTAHGFEAPITAHVARPLGQVDLLPLGEGEALLTWLEVDRQEKLLARLVTRRVYADGELGQPYVVTTLGVGPAWGTPRSARVGDEVLWVFTNPGNGNVDTELAAYMAKAPS